MIWKCLADKLPSENMRLGVSVDSVDPHKKKLSLSDGFIVEYEYLVSSIPLNILLRKLSGVPALTKQADNFLYSSTNLVGIGLEGSPPPVLKTKCWMYFVEDQFPFYRITVFSNYSQNNVPKPGQQWSLLCEISESAEKPVDQKQLQSQTLDSLKSMGLITDSDNIVSLWQKRLDYGYPTPFLDRDGLIEPIDKELTARQIYSRGRFGAWKYEVSNQDHSFMQGVEAIDHMLFGTEEITYHHPDVANAGKRSSRQPLRLN